MFRKLLQHCGALMEGQPSQITAADRTSISEDFAHVETAAGRERYDVAGDGAEHLRRILADRPASADEARKPRDVLSRLARQRAVRSRLCHRNLLPWSLIDDASCLSGRALDAVGIEDADAGSDADGILDDMFEPGGGRETDIRLGRIGTRFDPYFHPGNATPSGAD